MPMISMPKHAHAFRQQNAEPAPGRGGESKPHPLRGGRSSEAPRIPRPKPSAERELEALRRSDAAHPAATDGEPTEWASFVQDEERAQEQRAIGRGHRRATSEEARKKAVAQETFTRFRQERAEPDALADVRRKTEQGREEHLVRSEAARQIEEAEAEARDADRRDIIQSRISARDRRIEHLRQETAGIREATARIGEEAPRRLAEEREAREAEQAGRDMSREAAFEERASAVRERAQAEGMASEGADRPIAELLKEPSLTPTEAYRLAAFQMRRMNPEAEKAADLIRAADEAAAEGGATVRLKVENPFLAFTPREERAVVREGREAWMEKRNEIAGELKEIDAALQKIQGDRERMIDAIARRERVLRAFTEEHAWVQALVDAKERIVDGVKWALEKNADAAHPSNIDAKGNALKREIEVTDRDLADERTALRRARQDEKKAEALERIRDLESRQIAAKRGLRAYRGSEEQTADIATRKFDLAAEEKRLRQDLAEAEAGLAKTKAGAAELAAKRDREASDVDQWKDEQNVEAYLALQDDGIDALQNRRFVLEQKLRWIDGANIRAAAMAEIARASGTSEEGVEGMDEAAE